MEREMKAPDNYVVLLRRAREQVEASPLYRSFISGTPLENDIAVWMATFAAEVRIESMPNPDELADPTMSDTLGKNGEPLTDAEVDLFLAHQPSIDTAALARIRTRLEALIAEAKDIEPTPKADLLAALRREWERSQ